MRRYTVLSCGSNGNYQLGIVTSEDQSALQPSIFQTLSNTISSKPTKISCGGNHTLILLETGQLYSAGDNKYGQCGHSVTPTSKYLQQFTEISQINGHSWINMSCGWEFSILVNSNTEVFSCGLGLKGELGNGLSESELLHPLHKISSFDHKVIDIKSSLNHTVVKLDNGELYGWGNSRKGQLGEPKLPQISESRKINHSLKQVTDFALGREYTVIGDSNTNELILLGNDKFDILQSQFPEFKTFKSMWSSIHLQLSSNTIRSYGNNSHGQLFRNSSMPIKDYDIGSEHGLILNDKNEVFAWGWGEHGNCGEQSIDSVVFNDLNLLYDGKEKVVMISCGCATSWVVVECET